MAIAKADYGACTLCEMGGKGENRRENEVNGRSRCVVREEMESMSHSGNERKEARTTVITIGWPMFPRLRSRSSHRPKSMTKSRVASRALS